MDLGFAALVKGDRARAIEVVQESLSMHRELNDKVIIAYCLDGLAGVAGVLDKQPVRAAHLGGAAEALREEMGITLSPFERPHHKRLTAATRAQVDDATWEAAWSEGRGLPQEDAIALGLSNTGPQ